MGACVSRPEQAGSASSVPPEVVAYVARGELEPLVKWLRKNARLVNTLTSRGRTLLHVAVYRKQLAIVDVLLAFGADPNIATVQTGDTAVHYATSTVQVDVLQSLMQQSGDPNVPNKHGFTPLHVAVEEGHEDITRLFLRYGGNPNKHDRAGRTCMELAPTEALRALCARYATYSQPGWGAPPSTATSSSIPGTLGRDSTPGNTFVASPGGASLSLLGSSAAAGANGYAFGSGGSGAGNASYLGGKSAGSGGTDGLAPMPAVVGKTTMPPAQALLAGLLANSKSGSDALSGPTGLEVAPAGQLPPSPLEVLAAEGEAGGGYAAYNYQQQKVPLQQLQQLQQAPRRQQQQQQQQQQPHEQQAQSALVDGSWDQPDDVGMTSVHNDDSHGGEACTIDGVDIKRMLQTITEQYTNIPKSELLFRKAIGMSTFAQVFLAEWRSTPVAVKKLFLQDDECGHVRTFVQEMQAMRAIRNHPNIVLTMGVCIEPPTYAIVMEYMPMGSLYDLLHKKRRMPNVAQACRMAVDIARGMAFLHGSNPPIAHRDLKSPNLLLSESLTVKIADFGLTKSLNSTHMSTAVGTPAWMAPEVLRSEAYTVRADVYSFGIILWELFTGRVPHEGYGYFELIRKVTQDHVRPVIPASVPPAVAELMAECWDELPMKRPAFSDILKRLEIMQVQVGQAFMGDLFAPQGLASGSAVAARPAYLYSAGSAPGKSNNDSGTQVRYTRTSSADTSTVGIGSAAASGVGGPAGSGSLAPSPQGERVVVHVQSPSSPSSAVAPVSQPPVAGGADGATAQQHQQHQQQQPPPPPLTLPRPSPARALEVAVAPSSDPVALEDVSVSALLPASPLEQQQQQQQQESTAAASALSPVSLVTSSGVAAASVSAASAERPHSGSYTTDEPGDVDQAA